MLTKFTRLGRRAVTLLELLLVVLLIAILAAISIPAVMEAQTRSNVAYVHGTMAVMASAMEVYRIDNGAYPPTFYPNRVTSPIAYLTSLPQDAFETVDRRQPIQISNPGHRYFLYGGENVRKYLAADYYTYNPPFFPDRRGEDLQAPVMWMLKSVGPNESDDWSARYDPSNGTVSHGDLVRFGPG